MADSTSSPAMVNPIRRDFDKRGDIDMSNAEANIARLEGLLERARFEDLAAQNRFAAAVAELDCAKANARAARKALTEREAELAAARKQLERVAQEA